MQYSIRFLFLAVILTSATVIMVYSCKKDNDNSDENNPDPGLIFETFTDIRDGQEYKSVKIGEQTWMAENLNYDTANSICYNNDTNNGAIYGRLYNFTAARTACPDGWHLPSKEDWCTLFSYVDPTAICGNPGGVGTDAAYKLKSTSGWVSDGNGSDAFGFKCLPGGQYGAQGYFDEIGETGFFYASTTYPLGNLTHMFYMAYQDNFVVMMPVDTISYLSVRCVKD
jgi:uncharacterized protein (TIGR02145 family)